MTAQYDVGGNQVFSGSYAMSLNPCSSGQATSTGGGDLAGTLFYAADGTGVYKTQPGNATFFFPQASVTLSNLGGITYSGIQFDSSSGSTNNTSVVQVTSNASGNMFTVIPYSNVDTGALASTFTDTISITAANTPQNGMLLGSVTRTGTGAGGPTKIACLASSVGLKTQVICAGQSPSNSNTPYSVSFVADNNCPANYVRVPFDSTVGTTADFCVAKYEMSNDGSGNAVSSMTALPWTNIIRGNGGGDGGAIDKCQAIGAGYDLISNAEWQTVARNIEAGQDGGGNYLNWSNGSVSGSNYLNMGNMGMDGNYYYDPGSSSGLAADLDTNPCSGIPTHTNCATQSNSDWAYKRTFELSNGNIVWDFAGNDYTWVKDTYTNQGNSGAYASSEPWTGGGISTLWGPAGNYTSKNSGNYGGLGYQWLGYSGGAVFRGGNWNCWHGFRRVRCRSGRRPVGLGQQDRVPVRVASVTRRVMPALPGPWAIGFWSLDSPSPSHSSPAKPGSVFFSLI